MRVEMNERHGYAAESAVFCALMQWLWFVVTLIATAILQRLARAAGAPIPVEARATLSLGLLLLAAYVGGTLTHRLRWPRITGYLVAGLIAGPAWLGLIRLDELQVLGIVSNGALSLIAFGAGSQLSLDIVRGANRMTLLRVIVTALAVPFVLVTVVMLTVSPWFPLTAHQPFRDALVVALVLGAFSTIASPTVTWALIKDGGWKGPLSRSLLDVTILLTLAATVLVLVVLAIARPLASSGAVVPGSAMRAVLLLAGSVATGAGLGLLLAQYLRINAIHVTWALVAFAFIIAQAVRLAGLDAVLVALTAGCVVRNMAPTAHARLDVELERCAVPVHVVFFALAGAALSFDPLAALGLWPWAVLLVALRINGLRWASQLAGRWELAKGGGGGGGRESSRYGWLGLVSQGGMAITLAAVLRSAFPEWNVSLEALLVAMVGLHMLAGPICFQWALRRTGEVTERRGELDAPQTALVADGDSLVSRV
jgi:Kef-type K+ transport system membrane component KefB